MEILSPAGSFEALEAAVQFGADAVYVGGSQYSARSSAQNFTEQELAEAVEYCHLHGVKLYVCCNTLLNDYELSGVMAFVRYLYEIGVDALIVQDLGLIRRVRQELPDFPIHGSTQMTVVNHQGVKTLADLGLERVVLGREVTAEGLRAIREKTDTELEYFVHGALCISYSGQCLMSSILGGRSGNRGGCAQPCRLPYTLLRNGKPVSDNLPLLCPKDLCLAHRVRELADMGISSLKIEGRMKSPEYVAMVTMAYKQALSGQLTEDDVQNMLKFFSRGGSCEGYFNGCTFGDMMDTKDKPKIAGALPKLPTVKRQSPVSLSLLAREGEPLTLTVCAADGTRKTVVGAPCEKAHTKPTDAERMKQQIAKLGNTPFYADKIEVDTCGTVAVPVSELNDIRRIAVFSLQEKILASYRRTPKQPEAKQEATARAMRRPELCAEVTTKDQLKAAIEMGIGRIYLPEALLPFAEGVREPVVMLPSISREGEAIGSESGAVCIQNLGQLADCAGKTVTAGHRLNVMNRETAEMLFSMGARRVVLSPELNLKQMMRLCSGVAGELEVIGYGRLPLMLLENCIVKSTLGRCDCDNARFALRDRKNEVFPMASRHCGTVIYNSKPIYMADRMDELLPLAADGIRLCFTTEGYAECRQVMQTYLEALSGVACAAPKQDFTRGHFYRGVQ